MKAERYYYKSAEDLYYEKDECLEYLMAEEKPIAIAIDNIRLNCCEGIIEGKVTNPQIVLCGTIKYIEETAEDFPRYVLYFQPSGFVGWNGELNDFVQTNIKSGILPLCLEKDYLSFAYDDANDWEDYNKFFKSEFCSDPKELKEKFISFTELFNEIHY